MFGILFQVGCDYIVISVSGSRFQLLLLMYDTCDYVCHLSDPAADDEDAPVPADNQKCY